MEMDLKARTKPVTFAFCILLFAFSSSAQEVQRHGLKFENWINDTFFEGHRPDYTEKWDVSAEVNKNHGGIPVNPKAIRNRTSVDMGDALRQFEIDEPFLLVIGYWEQDGDYKNFVNIIAPRVEPETWRKLWEPITLEDLEKLDAVIKDRDLDYREARRLAQEIKGKPPFTEAIMVVNPKIDSRGQRRLQCSIRFRDVFEYLAPEKSQEPEEHPELWGVPFPNPIYSPPRTFRSADADQE